jgi:hypothetical protein
LKLIFLGLFALSSFAEDQNSLYCDIFGSVYIVDDPMLADFIVYEEASETFADIIIYEQTNRLYADGRGMWYFEESMDLATHKVYFTDREKEAQFTVYFTRFESFAGCNP